MKWLRLGDSGSEVERWQNFLCGYYSLARATLFADGDFGPVTLEYTKKFQVQHGLPPDGTVGNQTLGLAARLGFPLVDIDDHDVGPNWPLCPSNVRPLTDHEREVLFGKFSFVSASSTSNPEAIKIIDDWGEKNIVAVKIPQLARVANAPRELTIKVHKKISKQIVSLFQMWEDEKLIDKVKTWNGSFVPRYIRGSRTRLSNHSWGTAFDINVQWNGLGVQPALKGALGSVRELILSAVEHGFYWGGFYKNRPDGMHLEAYKVL